MNFLQIFILTYFKAVEVYLCDIRPIEKDLTWSVPSRSFIIDRLLKHKEFVGKIQLAAGKSK